MHLQNVVEVLCYLCVQACFCDGGLYKQTMDTDTECSLCCDGTLKSRWFHVVLVQVQVMDASLPSPPSSPPPKSPHLSLLQRRGASPGSESLLLGVSASHSRFTWIGRKHCFEAPCVCTVENGDSAKPTSFIEAHSVPKTGAKGALVNQSAKRRPLWSRSTALQTRQPLPINPAHFHTGPKDELPEIFSAIRPFCRSV